MTERLIRDWINRLEEPFREFVYRLETDANPSGNIRDAICQRENAMALAARVRELEDALAVVTKSRNANHEKRRAAEAKVKELEEELKTERKNHQEEIRELQRDMRGEIEQARLEAAEEARHMPGSLREVLERLDAELRRRPYWDREIEEVRGALWRVCTRLELRLDQLGAQGRVASGPLRELDALVMGPPKCGQGSCRPAHRCAACEVRG